MRIVRLLRRVTLVALTCSALLASAIFLLPGLQTTRTVLAAIAARAGWVVGLESFDFEFQSAGETQSGTVILPKNDRPIAVIVLIHGSGRTDRRQLLWLARLLAADGFAAAAYDKRGVAKSGGTFVGGYAAATATNLELLANDAAAAAAVLSAHPRLKGIPIGYVGGSQAGWIAPIAATKTPRVSFVALLSGPVASVGEEKHFSDLAEGDSAFWDTHSREGVAEYMKTAPRIPDDFDPQPILSGLTMPMRWSFGGEDNIMPVDLSVVRIGELIAQGRVNYSHQTYADLGHELVVPTIGLSGLDISRPYADMVAWLKAPSTSSRR